MDKAIRTQFAGVLVPATFPFCSWFLAIYVMLLAILGSSTIPPCYAAGIDATAVLNSIDRGVAYLKREQNRRGQWSDLVTYEGGVTSLCTLALLNSGVPNDDPVILRALDYLRSLQLEKTYCVSLQTMALCAGDPQRDLLLIQRNVEWLEKHQVKQGERSGAWSYPAVGGGDNSNSQFAVLALYEAEKVGATVQRETWQRSIDYWRRTQNPDGSWGYVPQDGGSGSMTCAGIGGLAISAAAIEESDAAVRDGQVVCCIKSQHDAALERAVDWMGEHFSVRYNPRLQGSGSQPCLYYYLYGLERAGRLTARRFMGDHDWYREGTEFIVSQQDTLSHYWKGTWHDEAKPHISTALALLFLSKGRRPVIIAKLKYDDTEDWNQHGRDAAHLAAYTEERWSMGLTWQVIDPRAASVDDLSQAPVLYVSGRKAPQLLPFADKLRDYVDQGGFLLAEACCQESEAFDLAIRQLMEAVFPEPEYRLQQLPPGHPIWRMEDVVRPDSRYAGKLWGVEYGCRTCVVYSETDLSCSWELARPGGWKKHPRDVENYIRDGLIVGVNVLTYATGREPKGKEQSFNTLDDIAISAGQGARGVLEVVKLRHGGGCDDAPQALANLVRAASQGELKLDIRQAESLIGLSDSQLSRFPLAFMHGRHDFRLTPDERAQLRTYLQQGGTLLADAICASEGFVAAFRRELQQLGNALTLEAIPPDDPLFTAEFGGFDIREVTLREPADARQRGPVVNRQRSVPPQLEGIKLGGRWAVIFSPYDLSCGLENHEAVQCRGYRRRDAARIGLNVLAYTINQ